MGYMNIDVDHGYFQAKIYLAQISLDLAKSWGLYELHIYLIVELIQPVLNKILKKL